MYFEDSQGCGVEASCGMVCTSATDALTNVVDNDQSVSVCSGFAQCVATSLSSKLFMMVRQKLKLMSDKWVKEQHVFVQTCELYTETLQ